MDPTSSPPPRVVRALYGAARHVVQVGLGSRPAVSAARLWGVRKATVFMLHRFADGGDRGGRTDIAMLRSLLGTLRRRRIALLSLRELVAHMESRTALPGPSVVFTVDDGYADFGQLAAPIFAGFECPVTTFVVTDFVGQRQWNWWDRIAESFRRTPRPSLSLQVAGCPMHFALGPHLVRRRQAGELIEALKHVSDAERRRVVAGIADWLDVDLPALPPPPYAALTWKQIRRLETQGVEFAPHTRTHPVLSRLADDVVADEIAGSWSVLQRECRDPAPIFGYPQGTRDSFGPREVEAVRASGLRAAVTFNPRYVAPESCSAEDRFALSRFALPADLAGAVYLAGGLAWAND